MSESITKTVLDRLETIDTQPRVFPKKTKSRLLIPDYKTATCPNAEIGLRKKVFLGLLYPAKGISFLGNQIKILIYKLLLGSRRLKIGKNINIIDRFSINFEEEEYGEKGKITIGNNLSAACLGHFANNQLTACHGGKIEIGNDVILNGVIIRCFKNIKIGNRVLIAWGTQIFDTDFHPVDKLHPLVSKDVIIEDDVWIGANCLILKGITIGQGAVIGAGSVVRKNVPPNTLVLGNPAKEIRKIGPR